MIDRVVRTMLLAAVIVLASEVKRLRDRVDRLCDLLVSNANRNRSNRQFHMPSSQMTVLVTGRTSTAQPASRQGIGRRYRRTSRTDKLRLIRDRGATVADQRVVLAYAAAEWYAFSKAVADGQFDLRF
ncbi:hypothetical protein [Nocardia sp. XZ_19_369]|uniref:hypothetical protein n=1 Tax=Nocardia sp. XZ_19_369 TaxID=2769487 RepID=UPI00188DF68F|nr:hypothetical protein [Nocardia sp. XZ_19_369]